MNFGFELTMIYAGRRTAIYSVLIDGENKTELERFKENSEFALLPDHLRILRRLQNIADITGAQERWFKREVRPRSQADTLRALHHENADLRLYCCRWAYDLLIVGYGGIKRVAAYQDDPALDRCVAQLEYVHGRLVERIRSNEIVIVNGWFGGNLRFEQVESYL